MPSNTGRSAIRLATLTLLTLLAGGCGGGSASPTAASATTTTTTAAPTTTTIPPLDAKELAWLKGVSAVRTKVEKSFQTQGPGTVTRAIMVESGNQMAAWSRQLRRLGTPTDRLQPAYTLVRKVIQTYDKGAKCYARAAGAVSESGAVDAGTRKNGSPARGWTVAVPPRGTAPACSTRPTPRVMSSRPRTANELSLGRAASSSRGGSLVLPPRPGWRDLAGRCWHARPPAASASTNQPGTRAEPARQP